jgi:hypothetical protein
MPAQLVACGHFFCQSCLLKWLEVTNTCPLCRQEVAFDPPDPEELSEYEQKATRYWDDLSEDESDEEQEDSGRRERRERAESLAMNDSNGYLEELFAEYDPRYGIGHDGGVELRNRSSQDRDSDLNSLFEDGEVEISEDGESQAEASEDELEELEEEKPENFPWNRASSSPSNPSSVEDPDDPPGKYPWEGVSDNDSDDESSRSGESDSDPVAFSGSNPDFRICESSDDETDSDEDPWDLGDEASLVSDQEPAEYADDVFPEPHENDEEKPDNDERNLDEDDTDTHMDSPDLDGRIRRLYENRYFLHPPGYDLEADLDLDAAARHAYQLRLDDPDEPRYCICGDISFGDMIACDGDKVRIQKFFSLVEAKSC